MKCIKSLVYNGHRYQVGEEFEVVSAQDRKILAAIRKAELVVEDAVPVPVVETPKKRTYTRRDMVAEVPRAMVPEVPAVSSLPPVESTREPDKE
jgi:hypothetical protein